MAGRALGGAGATLTARSVIHRLPFGAARVRGLRHRGRVDIEQALADARGAARRADLLLAGVPERALVSAVRAGRVAAVGHGTFALPAAPTAVVAARLFRASIGCVTACEEWGLPLWRPYDLPHLVVPRHRSQSRRAPAELSLAVIHRTQSWGRAGLWVPPLEAIDQATRCTSPLEQLALIDAALHRELILARDLAHLSQGDARRRAWLRRMASGAAESPLETVTRVALLSAGFRVREQVVIAGVGRVDFVVEESVVAEADGWEFHGSRDAFERDRQRDRLLLARRLPVMRFTARELRGDLNVVVARVAAAVGRDPHRDTASRLAWAVEG